jgi:hypothetical protein
MSRHNRSLSEKMDGATVMLRDEVADLRSQLAQCYRISGADPGIADDMALAARAVEAVRQLRTDYDAAIKAPTSRPAITPEPPRCTCSYDYGRDGVKFRAIMCGLCLLEKPRC